jgi:hypothetical protein
MIEILKNAKLNEMGVRMLYNDFNSLNKVCMEYMYEIFATQINYITYLVEIFNTPISAVDSFVDNLDDDKYKYDNELVKVLIKKRKAMKN